MTSPRLAAGEPAASQPRHPRQMAAASSLNATAGKRLFDGFDRDVDLEVAEVYSSPYATHVRYTVTK